MEIIISDGNSNFTDLEIRWYLSSQNIWIGKYKKYSEIEDLIPKSYGSFQWLWSGADTLLFDRDKLNLNTAILKVKEPINLNADRFNTNYTENIKSSICIKNKENFSISISDSVDYFYKDDILFSQVYDFKDVKAIKCMITEDFGFIIQNNLLMGWILYNASTHISPDENSIIHKRDSIPYLKEVLTDYLSIVKNIDNNLTENEEGNLRNLLTRLYNKVNDFSESQFQAIKASILNTLEYL